MLGVVDMCSICSVYSMCDRGSMCSMYVCLCV